MEKDLRNSDLTSSDYALQTQTQSTVTLVHEISSKEDDYNPLEHRKLAHPTSTVGSFFHLLKSSLGTGLLAMPMAFKSTGLIPGAIGTIFVAVIATHCVHILVNTSRQLCRICRVPSLSYADTCEEAFKHGPKELKPYSTFVRYFADSAMAGICIGGTSVYVLFIATSLKDVLDHFCPSSGYSIPMYCLMLLLPLILITQIRYLKFLEPFSLFANLCLLATFGITFYYIFKDVSVSADTVLAESVINWPIFLTTAIFAIEGINVVMPVENEMKNPQNFLGCPGVLNMTMILVSILYGTVGIVGYLKYGKEVGDIITLNLPQDEILAISAKIMVAVAVFFTYCLQMYAPMDIMWTRLRDRVPLKFHNLVQISMRTCSVVVTVILAAAVPDLGLLINLVGAIFFSTLGLLIPVVVQTVHRWERGLGKFKYILLKNGFLVMFYVLVLVTGCYTSIKNFLNKYSTS